MKTIIFTFIGILSLSLCAFICIKNRHSQTVSLQANHNISGGKIIELDLSDKSLAFSRYAKLGKISVFIISTHTCPPCKQLKMALQNAFDTGEISAKEVDIYYCLVSKNSEDRFETMDMRNGYRNFKYVDVLTEIFPTTYILAPTTNCFAIVKGNHPEQIIPPIQDLTIAKQQYFTLSALDYGNPKGEQNYSEMEKEIAELKKENEELKAQIQANAYRPQYPVQTENTTAYSPPPVQKNIPVANSSNAYFTRLRSNFEVLSSKQLSDPSINQFKICRLSLVVNNNHIHEKEFLKSKIRVATSIDKKAIIISNGDFLSGMSNDFFSEYQVNRNDLRYIPEQGEIQCIFPNFTIEEVMPARTTPGCIYIDFLYSDN